MVGCIRDVQVGICNGFILETFRITFNALLQDLFLE